MANARIARSPLNPSRGIRLPNGRTLRPVAPPTVSANAVTLADELVQLDGQNITLGE